MAKAVFDTLPSDHWCISKFCPGSVEEVIGHRFHIVPFWSCMAEMMLYKCRTFHRCVGIPCLSTTTQTSDTCDLSCNMHRMSLIMTLQTALAKKPPIRQPKGKNYSQLPCSADLWLGKCSVSDLISSFPRSFYPFNNLGPHQSVSAISHIYTSHPMPSVLFCYQSGNPSAVVYYFRFAIC